MRSEDNRSYSTAIWQSFMGLIVAARHKIVEGAVGMVESALALLSEKEIIVLDEEKKAAMVSNLLVVLCGDKDTQPVVNTGTLHQ